MSLLENTISEAISYASERGQSKLEFCFCGGEPLLAGMKCFESIVEIQKQHQSSGLEVVNTVQTNGTLIDKDWALFFKENHFGVSVSLDGPDVIQNRQRPKHNGKGSFATIMSGLDALRSQSVPYGLLGVITEDTASEAASIMPFLLSLEPRLVDFLPCADRGSVVTSDSFGEFLVQAFDIWIDSKVNPNSIPVKTFRDLCLQISGIQISKRCDYFGECTRTPIVTPDGVVAVCDQYVGKESGLLGNITGNSGESVFNSELAQRFREFSATVPDGCSDCDYLDLCRGGCTQRRSGKDGIDYLCSARIRLFTHVSEKLITVLDPVARTELKEDEHGVKTFTNQGVKENGRSLPS